MLKIVTSDPLNAETVWSALEQAITPTASFFKRNHSSFPEPLLGYGLEVHGQTFRLEDLKALGSQTVEATLECAGNARLLFSPQPPGTAWGIGAVSNGRWTGVPLKAVLELAPPPPDCCELVFESVDGEGDRLYGRSLRPEEAADHAWLIWGLNDEPLPHQHGGPLRLLVPGWYGMASVKWLRRIYSLRQPFLGYYQAEDYQYIPAGGPSRPLSRMLPKSLIVTPQDGQRCSPGLTVRGWAWSGHASIVAVEVEVDGTVHPAELEPERSPHAWRGWSLQLKLSPGKHRVHCLARDASGRSQPLEAPWNEQGYENNSAHRIELEVRAVDS